MCRFVKGPLFGTPSGGPIRQHELPISGPLAGVPRWQGSQRGAGQAAAQSTRTGGVAGTTTGGTLAARFGRMLKNCFASAALFKSR